MSQVRVLSPLLPRRIRRCDCGNALGMDMQEVAELQVVLEGVALPAEKRELVSYARREDEEAARRLESLPEREYRSLDEVGEMLAPVQPSQKRPVEPRPREESGEPPGGESYADPDAEPGALRPRAPARNPPQRTLEQQAKAQK